MSPVSPSLLVFLKYPEPGKVKTRLGAAVGMDRAAQLYRQWVQHVLQQVQAIRNRVRLIAVYDGAPLDAFAPWHHLVDLWWAQNKGHLGNRLTAAFYQAQIVLHKVDTLLPNSSSGNWQDDSSEETTSASRTPMRTPVCAIGTDCLELDALLLQRGFDLLQHHDVVIGPTYDGGYYLIGTANFIPHLFDNIRWSSPWTLEDQVRQSQTLGYKVVYLPPRADIDTVDDWHAYCRRSRNSEFSEPGP